MLRINGLSKQFGENEIFSDLSLDIEQGSVCAVTSPSGFGKTTLLRMISGIDKSYEGSIHGNESISYCPQDLALLPWYSAYKNVTAFIGNDRDAEIKEAFERMGLGDALDKKPHELSGGMKQRIALIRAWLSRSDVVLLDEPFKGLDNDTKLAVIAYLKETKEKDRTVIFTTHNSDEIELFADKTVSLA